MIFFSRAEPRLPSEISGNGSLSSIDYSSIRSLEPIELRNQVLQVISSSIQVRSSRWQLKILSLTFTSLDRVDCMGPVFGPSIFGKFFRYIEPQRGLSVPDMILSPFSSPLLCERCPLRTIPLKARMSKLPFHNRRRRNLKKTMSVKYDCFM